jgi:hypothetical protein
MRFAPLKEWGMFGGGTGAAEGKHGYDLQLEEISYMIQPFTTAHGRHAGYHLRATITGRGKLTGIGSGLWHGINPDGTENNLMREPVYRSPQAAQSAAKKHYLRVSVGGGGKRRKNADAPRCSRCGRQTRKSVSGPGYFCTSKRCGEYTSAPSTSSRLGALVSDINKLTR